MLLHISNKSSSSESFDFNQVYLLKIKSQFLQEFEKSPINFV